VERASLARPWLAGRAAKQTQVVPPLCIGPEPLGLPIETEDSAFHTFKSAGQRRARHIVIFANHGLASEARSTIRRLAHSFIVERAVSTARLKTARYCCSLKSEPSARRVFRPTDLAPSPHRPIALSPCRRVALSPHRPLATRRPSPTIPPLQYEAACSRYFARSVPGN
jgi:hypothetical protein